MFVLLPGCTLLFYETYGKGSPEQETSPSYALLAEDGIVQAVPEHPKKENVFCLSNVYGDVYLFQVGPECWCSKCLFRKVRLCCGPSRITAAVERNLFIYLREGPNWGSIVSPHRETKRDLLSGLH